MVLTEWLIGSCADRSPGDISDDDDARDFQDFSSNDDLSDIDAGDERPTHLSKLHPTRLNFSSQVRHTCRCGLLSRCCYLLKCVDGAAFVTEVLFSAVNLLNMSTLQSHEMTVLLLLLLYSSFTRKNQKGGRSQVSFCQMHNCTVQFWATVWNVPVYFRKYLK